MLGLNIINVTTVIIINKKVNQRGFGYFVFTSFFQYISVTIIQFGKTNATKLM